MAETFEKNMIAAGYDNISGLTNIEAITVNGHYFPVVEDFTKWSDGAYVRRGGGILQAEGYPSTSWNSGAITLKQWYYLYTNILAGRRSGEVTMKTRRYDLDRYVICNAVLDIGNPPTLTTDANSYKPFNWKFTRLVILEQEQMHGNLYAKDASTAQAGITTTPVLLTGFAADGLSDGTTPAHASDNITVAYAGTWEFSFDISATAEASTLFLFYIRVNAVEGNFGCQCETNATPDAVGTSMQGTLTLAANDVVTVYVQSDEAGGKDLTPVFLSLTLESIALT